MEINDKSRKMEGINFSGASFSGNTIFQGDDNEQTYHQTKLDSELEGLFEKLFEEINNIADPSEREDNLDDAKKLKEAVANKNKERVTKFFGRLGKGIQISAAGATLANALAPLFI
ncbi:hypothetical protein KIH86_17575 [Paenibacillus sp. HN-1]|nr:hypothetical protein [Paenibacillus sp. CGMCC 1.18879]MBY9078322.1 hypothetical protein [Paenibacillus sp. CGMCC 1.18879]MBY9086020.1 hypothetical protein [Paenibacillus sinensis]